MSTSLQFTMENIHKAVANWQKSRTSLHANDAQKIYDLLLTMVPTFKMFFDHHKTTLSCDCFHVIITQWNLDITHIQYVCLIFDHVSKIGLRSGNMENPELWFKKEIQDVCNEICFRRTKVVVPRAGYEPTNTDFIKDTSGKLETWTNWSIEARVRQEHMDLVGHGFQEMLKSKLRITENKQGLYKALLKKLIDYK